MLRLVIALGMALGLCSSVLADTIHCETWARDLLIDFDIDFMFDGSSGQITRVRAEMEDLVLSTDAADLESPDDVNTLAFAIVFPNRISFGLRHSNIGPMTMVVDLLRYAEYEYRDDPETDLVVAGVVVAGVVYGYSTGTGNLQCSGW